MTREDAVKHLENMKWLLGVNNTTVDDIPLTKVIDDIAALLKAQEPIIPVPGLWDRDIQGFNCGACNAEIGPAGMSKYCSKCGRAVKWEC